MGGREREITDQKEEGKGECECSSRQTVAHLHHKDFTVHILGDGDSGISTTVVAFICLKKLVFFLTLGNGGALIHCC